MVGQQSENITVVFKKSFATVPSVIATVSCSVSQANNSLQVTILEILTSGFTCKIKNNQQSAGYNAGYVTLSWVPSIQ